jgi:hypothetical protein
VSRLTISPDLSLPTEAVTEAIGFLGRRGSGKSYAAQKLAEEFHRARAQFVVLDPVGNWWALRLAADGKDAGIPIPVFGGLQGDVPLEPTAGKLVADTIVDRGISGVIDVSQFESDADKSRFARAFCERFYFRKKSAPSAVHVFLEECLTPDTEILTPGGWQRIDLLSAGQQVVAYDPTSGRYANEAISRVIEKPFKGDLVHLKTTSIDCLATPGHRAVMRRFQHDPKRYKLYPWTFCEASKLPRDFQIPSGEAPYGEGVDVPDDLLRTIGWVITDGYFNDRTRGYIGIQQSSSTVKMGQPVVETMRTVLARLGCVGDYARAARVTSAPQGPVRGVESSQFYLGARLSRALRALLGDEIHRIPRQLLRDCTRRQLEVLYLGLLEGDGTAKAGRWSRFYAGLSEGLADDFQEIATRLGVRTVKKLVPQNGQWVVMISETRDHWVRNRRTSVAYSGNVYCVTVPSGAFVARRNGTVFVTGNCQEFVPQNPGKDEPLMLHAFTRLAKLGRNFGIGISMISQRPQEVNKKVLNLAELLFVFQLTGVHERKAVEAWIGDKGIDGEDIEAELPKLERGHPHAWSPAWLKVSKIISIGPKWTFDASSTPKLGAQASPVRELSPIDLEQLRANMATAIEKAKADDPKELRKEIATLRTQLTKAQQTARVVEKTVVDERAIKRAAEAAASAILVDVNPRLAHIRRAVAGVARAAKPLVESLAALEGINLEAIAAPNGNGHIPRTESVTSNKTPLLSPARVTPRAVSRAAAVQAEGVSKAMQRILDGLALFETLGISPVKRVNAAFMAGYTENGHFNNMVGTLRTSGYLNYPGDGTIELTDEGRAIADASRNAVSSLDDLHALWLSKVSASEGKLLRVVIDRGLGNPISRADLAAETGYTENGHFNNMVGHLRSLGAFAYPGDGSVVATDVLFPEGLD